MDFINLTPHDVNCNGRIFPKSAIVARCSSQSTVVQTVDGIDLCKTEFGEVQDLPAPSDDTFYIVSALVRSACPERKDLVSPGDLLRDAEGKVIGCKNFNGNF